MIELPAQMEIVVGGQSFTLYAGGADTARDGKNWYFTGDVLLARVFIDCQFSLFDAASSGVPPNLRHEPRDLKAFVTAHAIEQAVLKRDWMAGNDMDRGQPFHPEER